MQFKKLISVLILTALCSFPAYSSIVDVHGVTMDNPDSWIASQKQIAITRMLGNVSRSDAAAGSVVAAPSHDSPNYYFHWIRDAAITMDEILSLYQGANSPSDKAVYQQDLEDYISFSRQNQLAPTLTGLGEPKFYPTGEVFSGPWGRPQNDGPALRVIALTHVAYQFLNDGQQDYVRRALYDGTLPTNSVIKADLEYVSHHWQDPSFDLWEEVKGDHFFTRMVQRRALIEGAGLARVLGDSAAADFYQSQAEAIQQTISLFWSDSENRFVPTLNRVDGIDWKTGDLDVAVVLGVLWGDAGDGFLPVSDSRVQSTMTALAQSFATLYPINQRSGVPAIAIGRYPEDRYSGTVTVGGNPWILATAAFAEAEYKASREVQSSDANLAQQYRKIADQFMLRLQYHASSDGSMSEQLDKTTGYMTSAPDLSWSYAAFLTAAAARDAAPAAQ